MKYCTKPLSVLTPPTRLYITKPMSVEEELLRMHVVPDVKKYYRKSFRKEEVRINYLISSSYIIYFKYLNINNIEGSAYLRDA